MNAIGMIELVVALAVVAAALVAFNALVGKGPRGTVWIVAAAVFTWASMLPVAFRDPDGWPLSRELDLIVPCCDCAARLAWSWESSMLCSSGRRTSGTRLPN